MEEDTKTEQSLDVGEEQLQAITGGTGGRYIVAHAADHVNPVAVALEKHAYEAKQALNSAEFARLAGNKKGVNSAIKEANQHFEMISRLTQGTSHGEPVKVTIRPMS